MVTGKRCVRNATQRLAKQEQSKDRQPANEKEAAVAGACQGALDVSSSDFVQSWVRKDRLAHAAIRESR